MPIIQYDNVCKKFDNSGRMAVPDPALFYRDLFGRLPDPEALHAGYGHFRPAGASCNLLRGDLFTGGYGAVLVVVFPGRSYVLHI